MMRKWWKPIYKDMSINILNKRNRFFSWSMKRNALLLEIFCQTVARLNQYDLKENEFGIEDTCPKGWHE